MQGGGARQDAKAYEDRQILGAPRDMCIPAVQYTLPSVSLTRYLDAAIRS
jgi:hypothetical protein